MAGGIDWFRWHHGSVTDPKFGLIAKKAGVRVSDAIAMWAFVLENASAEADRGTIGQLDFEAIEHLLGLEDGQAIRILDAMTQRGLIEGSRISSWDKRQPKRERDTDNSADRTRAYRERQKQQGDDARSHVTPCDATERQKNAREEESREEKDISVGRADMPTCSPKAIIDLYHEVLPELPAVRLTTEARKKAIGKLWRWVLTSTKTDGSRRAYDAEQAMTWLRDYFTRARDNDFLMGRTGRTGEHANWQCDLDFLLTEKGMKHVIEKTKESA